MADIKSDTKANTHQAPAASTNPALHQDLTNWKAATFAHAWVRGAEQGQAELSADRLGKIESFLKDNPTAKVALESGVVSDVSARQCLMDFEKTCAQHKLEIPEQTRPYVYELLISDIFHKADTADHQALWKNRLEETRANRLAAGSERSELPGADGIRQFLGATDQAPGAAFMVALDRGVLGQTSVGAADIEKAIPIGPDTNFQLASLSKSQVAFAVLYLQEKGRISLTDPIEKHLGKDVLDIPGMAKLIEGVTVRQCLDHSSGIPNYFDYFEEKGIPASAPMTNRDILKLMAESGKREFAPGEKQSYTNTGYLLIGCALENVTGQRLKKFFEDKIFKPLGMNNTFIFDETRPEINGLAKAYEGQPGSFTVHAPGTLTVGDGGVCSNLKDMRTWVDALSKGNNLISNESLDLMFTNGKFNDGTLNPRGLGVWIEGEGATRQYQNLGADAGFETAMLQLPLEKFSMAALSNGVVDSKLYAIMKVVTAKYLGDERAAEVVF